MVHDCFLGCAAPTGFVSFFDQLSAEENGLRLHIIKGGPGCGKSTMMKRMAARIEAAGHAVERVRCSSDPASIDGVVCESLGFAIVDGTAPHTLEPRIPAAGEVVVSLYDTMDTAALQKELDTLRPLFAANARLHERARRFLAAAGSLAFDVERTARGQLLTDKITRYGKNLAARLFARPAAARGREALRIGCAVTPDGIVDYIRDNMASADIRYVFDDRYYAAGHRLLAVLREEALRYGFDVITFRHPLAPHDKIDALFVPELSAAFAAAGYLTDFSDVSARFVHDSRFYDTEGIRAAAKRLAFCKKTVLSLLSEASALMAQAKAVHDDIEAVYKHCVDFDAVEAKEQAMMQRIGL